MEGAVSERQAVQVFNVWKILDNGMIKYVVRILIVSCLNLGNAERRLDTPCVG